METSLCPRNTYKIIGERSLGLLRMYKLFTFAALIGKARRRANALGLGVHSSRGGAQAPWLSSRPLSGTKAIPQDSSVDTRLYHLTRLPPFQTRWVYVVTLVPEAHAWEEFREDSLAGRDQLFSISFAIKLSCPLHLGLMGDIFF